MGVTSQLLTGMILQDTQLKKMSQNWELNPQGMKPPPIRYGKSLSPPEKTVCSIQPMQKRSRKRLCVWCAYFEHDPDCQISKKKHMITCIYTCVCLCTKFIHISIHLVLSALRAYWGEVMYTQKSSEWGLLYSTESNVFHFTVRSPKWWNATGAFPLATTKSLPQLPKKWSISGLSLKLT